MTTPNATLVRPILIYDGDCAFCSSSVRAMQKLLKKRPPMEPYQFLDLTKYSLTPEQCREEAKFIKADGTIKGGHLAFVETFKLGGGLWKVIGSIVGLPVLRSIAGFVYRWVAKNRYRLPGGTPTCALPKK
jgi:predicted DCC family thiol-disulfide oxidoreductase YuxK